MTFSLNEIETTLRKAALGAGLGFGAAEEVGRAAAWLCARELDGVAAALAGLDRAGPPSEALAEGEAVRRFRKAAAASEGLAAIDLLLGACGVREVRLEGLDAPWLLIGLAGVAAEAAGVPLRLCLGEAEALVGAGGLELRGAMPAGGCDATLTAAGTAPRGRAGAVAGAKVADEAWQRALALARRTYVPATDRSRLLGAGAGILDED